ncbi:MAG: hypothetical protein HGA67_02805 [Candidatus Yonathbacteria bacterium]|nr:hypothetical protein [Candidatus Yonathbacteria bacterium]
MTKIVDENAVARMGILLSMLTRRILAVQLYSKKPFRLKARLGVLPKTCPEHGCDLVHHTTIVSLKGKALVYGCNHKDCSYNERQIVP